MNPNTPPQSKTLAEMGRHILVSILATIILAVVVSGIYPLVVYGLAQVLFHHQANGSLIKKDGTPTDDESQAVGSSLIGQNFTAAQYFHPRPSAAGNGYDPTQSSGTNLGPLSDKLINGLTNATTQPETLIFDGVRLRTIHYAVDNNIPFKLYAVDANGGKTEVPLSKYEDSGGNLIDTALVDAFPHGGATAGLIAADFATLIPGDAVTASASGLDPHISPANAQLQVARVAGVRKVSVDQVQALIDQYTDKPDLGFLGDPGVNVLRLNLALDVKYPIPAAPPAPATQPATQPSK